MLLLTKYVISKNLTYLINVRSRAVGLVKSTIYLEIIEVNRLDLQGTGPSCRSSLQELLLKN